MSLLQGRIALEAGDPGSAIRFLERIIEQEPVYVAESMALLETAHEAMGSEQAYRRYLEHCLTLFPSISVVLALGRVIRDQEGTDALARFIANQMAQNPTLTSSTL